MNTSVAIHDRRQVAPSSVLAFQAGAVLLGAIWFPLHFGFNLVQAVAFRRYGFLAAIIVRVAMYLVWHIGYGNFICGC